MKRRTTSLVLLMTIMLVVSGCGEKKQSKTDRIENSSTSAPSTKKEKICKGAEVLPSLYEDAISPTSTGVQADQLKRVLVLLKMYVPNDVDAYIDELAKADAPVDPSKYSAAESQARTNLDSYLSDTCGESLDDKATD